MHDGHLVERKNNLTEADIALIENLLEKHKCRFPDITPTDMMRVKMVADDFDTIKKSVLDKVVIVVLVLMFLVITFWKAIKTALGQQ
jgi:Cu/Ag efflux pump CusA